MSKQITFDREEYSKLSTAKERAEFLLKQEFTVELEIIDLEPRSKVYVGGVGTPILNDNGHESNESMILRAENWLKELAV